MLKQVPNRNQLAKYVVNRPGWEAITQSLYDFTTYPAIGVTSLNFFALPVGSGGKTRSDTNMVLAGQMPTNQEFLITSVEVYFFPTTPTVAADLPAAFGAQAAADIINDTYIFRRSGNLELEVGSKAYVQEAPLMRFPPKTSLHIEGALSDASTIAADLQSRIAYAEAVGRPYLISPANVMLTSNQNFNVTIAFPEGLQALPSGNPARVGVVLDGLLYRRSQ